MQGYCEDGSNGTDVYLFIGFVTNFIFAIAMLYCIADFDAVLATSTGYVYPALL